MKNRKLVMLLISFFIFTAVFSSNNITTKATGVTTLAVSASTVPLNGTFDVTISNAQSPTQAKDWVGLYEENVVPNGNPAAIWWGYLVDLGVTDGNGTFTFDPASISSTQKSRLAVGKTYKFILAYNNGYTVTASVKFNTVAAQSPTIISYNPINLNTNAGVAPQLPATITANYSNGTSGTVNVTWNNIDPIQYSHAGSFTVKGVVPNTGVVAKAGVTVIEGSGPLFTFQVISDVHIRNNTASDIYYKHFQDALRDMNRTNPNSSALIFDGDFTNSGAALEYDTVNSILASIPHATPYFAFGNHEEYKYTIFNNAVSTFLSKTGNQSLYFDKWINNYHFIFLGTESKGNGVQADLSDTQLQWLLQKLGENSSPDKPIFVFLHQPLADTVGGSTVMKDIIKDKQLREILSQYPQTIFSTGHTHEVLTASNEFYNEQACNMVNTGSVGYLWYTPTYTQPGNGSQGLTFDVYPNKVVVKGREYTRQEWIAQYSFSTPPTGVNATSANASQINVSWNQVPGASSYDIDVDGVVITNVQPPYSHTGLINGSRHTYKVRTKNAAGGSSAWGQQISATAGLTATDLALNKQVLVDSTFGPGYEAKNAVDGFESSRWASSSSSTAHWVTTDLGTVQPINTIKLNWEASYGVDYKIQVSTDNSTWTDVETVTGNNSSGYKSYSFNTANARYVRIYATKAAAGTIVSLYSINVYNQ